MAEPKESKSGTLAKGMFGDRIVVDYGKKIKHKSPYLPDGHLSFSIIGASGCGKSTMMLNFIPQIANLSQIIICSLVTQNPVYDGIRQFCDERGIEFNLFNDPVTAEESIEDLIAMKEPGTQGLCIFDDFTRRGNVRSDPYTLCMTTVSKILRNYGYYSMYITQSATDVPTLVRNNANVRVVFRMGDHHAVRSMADDFASNGFGDKELFANLYGKISQLHSFIMLVNPGRIFLWKPGMDEPKQIRIDTGKKNDDDEELDDSS